MFLASALVLVSAAIPSLRHYFTAIRRRRLDADDPDHPQHRLRGAAGQRRGRAAPPAARGVVGAGHLVAAAAAGRPDRGPRRRWVAGRTWSGSCWSARGWSSPCGARPQFSARTVRGSFWRALAFFLVGGAVLLFVGAWLVSRFGDAPDSGLRGVLRVGQHARRPRGGRLRERRDARRSGSARHQPHRCGDRHRARRSCCSGRRRTRARSTRPTRRGSGRCCGSSGRRTRWATSRPVGTRRSCGRRGTRRRRGRGCPTGWSGR